MRAHLASLLLSRAWLPAPHAPARAAVRASVGSADAPLAVDVAVIGGGPAGYAIASRLAGTHGHAVALVDPDPDRAWPNNYGEWREEVAVLADRLDMPELLTDCIAHEWSVTDCFFGGSFDMPFDERMRLDRAYVQIDRTNLKAALAARLAAAPSATVIAASLRARATAAPNLFDADLVHDARGSDLSLSDGSHVRAKIVVDATGFESRLVRREATAVGGYWRPLPPGYQIAYGFTCIIEKGTQGEPCNHRHHHNNGHDNHVSGATVRSVRSERDDAVRLPHGPPRSRGGERRAAGARGPTPDPTQTSTLTWRTVGGRRAWRSLMRRRGPRSCTSCHSKRTPTARGRISSRRRPSSAADRAGSSSQN